MIGRHRSFLLNVESILWNTQLIGPTRQLARRYLFQPDVKQDLTFHE